jgi:glycosyltransferase involved in cell wall biosynthesis
VARNYALCPEHFQTIYGGVDPGEFQPPTDGQRCGARRTLGISDSETVITWTGRLSPEKNIDLLVRALACCHRLPSRVLIVGDGPARGELMQLSRRLGHEGVISFVGSHSDVRPFLHAADVFVFPSRGESFGGALVEAMACGLPCIALRPDAKTIRTATLEIIEHGKSGLLVDGAEPSALAAAIDRLVTNSDLRMVLGTAARQRVKTNFTWSGAAAQLDGLLSGLVSDRPRGRSRIHVRNSCQPAHA